MLESRLLQTKSWNHLYKCYYSNPFSSHKDEEKLRNVDRNHISAFVAYRLAYAEFVLTSWVSMQLQPSLYSADTIL